VEQVNGLLKRHLSKLAQETHLPWPRLLTAGPDPTQKYPKLIGSDSV
jgi:hypothetical protein